LELTDPEEPRVFELVVLEEDDFVDWLRANNIEIEET